MRSTRETSAKRIANAVRSAARHDVYGLRNIRPSAIVIHNEDMCGVTAADVLDHLNPRILRGIGIKFWQAQEPTGTYGGSVRLSANDLTDARSEVTFSHSPQFVNLCRHSI